MRVLVVDNYDSFTWNLVHYLVELGAAAEVVRNDGLDLAAATGGGAGAFLISPGPGRPEAAGASLALVAACAERSLPLLGICLGLQAIALHFGGRVEAAPAPVHGKTCPIAHDGSGLFAGLPSPLVQTRYHSLAVAPDALPAGLAANAWAPDGTLQGLRHRALPIHAVQFHPESVASAHGHRLLANFLALAAEAQKGT